MVQPFLTEEKITLAEVNNRFSLSFPIAFFTEDRGEGLAKMKAIRCLLNPEKKLKYTVYEYRGPEVLAATECKNLQAALALYNSI